MIAIKSKTEGPMEWLTLTGEVDASSSIELDNAMEASLKNGTKKLLVNCEGLEYISSAGLGVFMSYLEPFRKSGVRMVIYGLNDKVMNVFSILGLDELMEIAANQEDAQTVIDKV